MACYETARYLAEEIGKLGLFDILYDGDPARGIPAVSWKIKDGTDPGFTLYDLADRVASRGWQVPAYSLEPNCQNIVVQRILVRHGVSKDLASLLLEDFKRSIAHFEKHPVTSPMTAEEASGFSH